VDNRQPKAARLRTRLDPVQVMRGARRPSE
jgi:hypothetical protein